MIERPLEGIRILYFGFGVAGPFAGRYLGGLGAEVILIQSKSRIMSDASASLPWEPKLGLVPGFPGVGELNAETLAVGLELRNPKAVEIFNQLVKKSDVVMCAYGAGVPKKLGIDYEALREVKEDIIFIHCPSMGLTGPYANYDLYGFNVTPMTGITQTIGYPDLPEPQGFAFGGATLTDVWGGHSVVLAVISALHHRDKTGEGQLIDVSLMEVTVGAVGPAVLDYTANGVVAGPVGNRNPYAAPHGTYRCRGEDRWCAVVVRTEEEWQGLCRAIDPSEKDGLAADPRFATSGSRLENHDELDKVIEAFTSKLDPYEVMFLMQQEGVAAGVVQNMDDLLMRDIHMQSREHLVRVKVEKRGDGWAASHPLKMSATPPKHQRGAPDFAQDNDYVLKELLGKSDEEAAKLIEEGAVCDRIPADASLMNRSLYNRWTGRLGSSLPRADELKWGN